MGAYGRGYARGAQQPYTRLRWRVPWGVGVHARGQRSRCRAFGGLRRSASMRMHASAPKPRLICALIESPFWLICRKGETQIWVRGPPTCETLCETNECTSAKHCRRASAGMLVGTGMTKYSQLYVVEDGTGAIPGRTQEPTNYSRPGAESMAMASADHE